MMIYRLLLLLTLGCACLMAEDSQFIDVGFGGPPPRSIFILRDLEQIERPEVFPTIELTPDVSGVNLAELNADTDFVKAGTLTESRIPGSPRISISGNTTGMFEEMKESKEMTQAQAEALMRKYCTLSDPFALQMNASETATITMKKIDRKTLEVTSKVVTAYTVPFFLTLDGLSVFNGDHNVRIASNGLSHISYIPLTIRPDLKASTKQAPLTPGQSLRKFAAIPVDHPQLSRPFWVVLARIGYLLSGDHWKADSPRVRAVWRLQCQTGLGSDGEQFILWLAATDGAYLAAEFTR